MNHKVILYLKYFIISWLSIWTIQLAIVAYLFFTQTTRRIELFGRLVVESVGGDEFTIQAEFGGVFTVAVILTVILIVISEVKASHSIKQ